MTANIKTLEYLKAGVVNLIEHGSFRNGLPFKPTQGDALVAYHRYLFGNELTAEEKLKGFFELPTGVGKTALFLSIINEAHAVAREEGDTLRTMIVVPTLPLLKQTHDALDSWAPDYKDKVGVYGGRFRMLGKELTIITYDSWKTLMEEGKIDSSNVDILISDEAHRGTSERSLMGMFNSFASGTVQLAFTATARFDDEKSVEQSHGRKIFERSIGDSIRLGELAAYIQTQLYIIRVQPPGKSDEFNENSGVRAGMRQEAWMHQITQVYKEGRDEHTGDLLSDNKAGFYVSDTAMADRMAEMLSNDSILRERAKAKGCHGVAVAIHSHMSPTEQDALLEDFKNGLYMACVSDSKLKEGYDDPSLKTIFDFPRGSLVDKAQIIGRGARKWFNPDKQREEGSTFIDTIVYVGSDDKDEDKRLKEQAIRNAVMAWSVLDGTEVFSPDEEFPERQGGYGGGAVTPVLGLDVESYISLEDLQVIHAIKKKLQEENTIPLTDEMRDELKNKLANSYVSVEGLIRLIENLPESINAGKVRQWLTKGKWATKGVKEEDWNKVFEAAQQLDESDHIRLTKNMRSELRDTILTIRGREIAAAKIVKDAGLGHCVKSIKSWSDDNSSIYKVLKKDWFAVIDALSSKVKIPLTQEMKIDLKEKIERMNFGAIKLAKELNDNRITASKIKAWSYPYSETSFVVKVEWEFLNNSIEALLDQKPDVGGLNKAIPPQPIDP